MKDRSKYIDLNLSKTKRVQFCLLIQKDLFQSDSWESKHYPKYTGGCVCKAEDIMTEISQNNKLFFFHSFEKNDY